MRQKLRQYEKQWSGLGCFQSSSLWLIKGEGGSLFHSANDLMHYNVLKMAYT